MSQVFAIKVFEIPELASHVTLHLTRLDLCTCAMVNRAWHEAIVPILYHSVIIDDRHGRKGSTGICWDGFQKHSSHMRRLKIDNRARRDISLFGFNCTNLTVLHLVISADPRLTPQWSSDLLKMIANNPDISTLQLTSLDDPRINVIDHHLVVLGLFRYMPGLKKLFINSTRIGERSVNEVMRCAHRLEELALDTTQIFKAHIPGSWRSSRGLGSPIASVSLTAPYIRRDWTPTMMTLSMFKMGRTFWILKVASAGKGLVSKSFASFSKDHREDVPSRLTRLRFYVFAAVQNISTSILRGNLLEDEVCQPSVVKSIIPPGV
ncbi:hypothetical protein BGZ72_010873 [Mortierella alpina]|nr:hypothetical protein BGZ72_010873 [Mortierella alpina]